MAVLVPIWGKHSVRGTAAGQAKMEHPTLTDWLPVGGVLAILCSCKVVALLCQALVVYFGLGKLICILGYML